MQTDGATAVHRHCTIFVEENDVMVSRRMPAEIKGTTQSLRSARCECENPSNISCVIAVGIVGFIEWNRFCDRLDSGLGPLRSLAENLRVDGTPNKAGGYREQNAKTKALECFQEICDKLTNNHPALEFTLYCPFHSSLVSNWHIQVTVTDMQGHGTAPSSEVAETSEMTTPISNQVSESAAEDENSVDTSVQNTVTATVTTTRQEETPPPPLGATTSSQQEAGADGSEDAMTNQFCSSAGKGVLGVDYIEHTVLSTDTFKGLCLTYGISATRLRQANLLSGDIESLSLAPKVLAIPISGGFYARVQDTDSKDLKLYAVKKEFPRLGNKEAKA